MAPAVATYEPHDPSRTVLYQVIAEHLETFLASLDDDPDAKGLPAYVKREFYDYLHCGILAYGFLRLGCYSCQQEVLLAFSCKRRGFCASCAGRRMAQTAAHLVERVMPWVPTRQWVVSVPIPLRYWTAPSRDLTAQVHGIIRTTIAQFYVNQAVKRGAERQKVQPGSVTFLQRFGGSLNANLHYHLIVLEGVFLDRTDRGLTLRFLKGEPPSDADVAHVVQKISRRVIRTLRQLGYLEAGMEVPVATGYDPLLDNEPKLARTMAASVRQRIALLRAAIIPTPRQQGVDGDASQTGTPYWHWARLLGRIFDVAMATCPLCRRGSLRIIAALPQESVMTRILRHLQLASVPPPSAPARCRQELCACDDAHASVSPEATCAPRRRISLLRG